MAIDLRDYGRTSAQRGWGAGWPSCSGAAGDLATVVANNPDGSVAAKVTVRKRLARLVDVLLDECERRGYNFHANQCGGYNCRPIGGTRTASNHSWGVAIDLNWQLNPMRRPLTTNIPGWMVQMFNRYGFAWGGHYRGTPDTMHFEFMGTPTDADDMTALALHELTPHKEDDMFSDDDRRKLDTVLNQMTGSNPPKAWDFPGFPSLVNGALLTPVDMIRWIDNHVVTIRTAIEDVIVPMLRELAKVNPDLDQARMQRFTATAQELRGEHPIPSQEQARQRTPNAEKEADYEPAHHGERTHKEG